MKIRNHRPLAGISTLALFASLLAGGCTKESQPEHGEQSESTALVQDPSAWRGNIIYRETEMITQDGDQKAMLSMKMDADLEDVQTPAVLRNIEPASSMKPQEKKAQTILIYMIASDLESNVRVKAATNDINEMLGSGMKGDDVNLVIYAGGTSTWWNGLPNSSNCYLVYDASKEDMAPSFQVYADEKQNMSDPETLSGFLNKSAELFPADSFSLILWDHGSGPYIGYGNDETYPAGEDEVINVLTLAQLKEALEQSPFQKDKLDLIGFDACLMASIETASLLAPYARWMVASPETEPGFGWCYRFLENLDGNTTSTELADSIINQYAEYIDNENRTRDSSMGYSLTAMDLSRAETLSSAWDEFILALVSQTEKHENDYLRLLMDRTKETQFYGYNQDLELYDAGHLACQFSDLIPEQSQVLLDAIADTVPYGVTNIAGSSGLSAYFPSGIQSDYSALKASLENDAVISRPVQQMETVLEMLRERKSKELLLDPDAVSQTRTESAIQIGIPEDIYPEVARISMVIFRKDGDSVSSGKSTTTYHPVVEDIPLSMNDEGIVSIDLDPELITVNNAVDNRAPVRVRYAGKRQGKTQYQTVKTSLVTADVDELLNERIFVYLDFSVEDGKCRLENISPMDDSGDDAQTSLQTLTSNLSSSRASVSTRGFHVFVNHSGSWVEYENDRIDRPWTDALVNAYSWDMIDMAESTYFEQTTVSEFYECQFSYQVLIEDYQGNIHLAAAGDYPRQSRIHTQQTPRGEFGFLVEADHAELLYYEGRDRVVKVPSHVQGKAVTKIRSKAFSEAFGHLSSLGDASKFVGEIVLPDTVEEIGSAAMARMLELHKVNIPPKVRYIPDECFLLSGRLSEIVLPEGLTAIGECAFRNTGLQTVCLPDSLERIDDGAFSSCNRLFSIDTGGNPNFVSKQNMLIDLRDRRLISCFGSKTQTWQGLEELTVPDGTEIIGALAFEGWGDPFQIREETDKSALKRIRFPDSLRRIGQYACLDLFSLEEIALPDHLEEIEEFAFGSSSYTYDSHGMKVKIGPSVKYIGYGSFCQFGNIHFQVDPKNPYYSSVDGQITNLAKDAVLPVYLEDRELEELP